MQSDYLKCRERLGVHFLLLILSESGHWCSFNFKVSSGCLFSEFFLTQAAVQLELPPCDIEEKRINQDGEDVRITIVRPKGVTKKLAAFMFFHGGGWILGDFPTHERFVRDLVFDSCFPAVFVNYPLSPEAKYPTAINQAYKIQASFQRISRASFFWERRARESRLARYADRDEILVLVESRLGELFSVRLVFPDLWDIGPPVT